jgi:hypothetical protein
VRRVVIDNNGIDPFVDLPGAYEAARAAIDKGNLEIRYVHTTLTEAANIPDADRRDRVLLFLACLGKCTPSYGIVLDESRFDQAAFADEAGAADLEALASGNKAIRTTAGTLWWPTRRRPTVGPSSPMNHGCGSALQRSVSRC